MGGRDKTPSPQTNWSQSHKDQTTPSRQPSGMYFPLMKCIPILSYTHIHFNMQTNPFLSPQMRFWHYLVCLWNVDMVFSLAWCMNSTCSTYKGSRNRGVCTRACKSAFRRQKSQFLKHLQVHSINLCWEFYLCRAQLSKLCTYWGTCWKSGATQCYFKMSSLYLTDLLSYFLQLSHRACWPDNLLRTVWGILRWTANHSEYWCLRE